MGSDFDPNTIYECATPPLVEMYIGVGFAPVTGVDLPHYGIFWSQLRDRFPKIEKRPPLQPSLAPETVYRSDSGDSVTVRDAAASRFWFVDASDEELIQVQADRFIRNWRKRPSGSAYPRYSELKPRFIASWVEFSAFLDAEQFPQPTVLECELGYVNRFETGEKPVTWAVPPLANLHGVIPGAHVTRCQVGAMLSLPENLGSVNMAVGPDHSPAGGAWRHTIVAKGKPAKASVDGISDWLDSVRVSLNHLFVKSFCDELHAQWGTGPRS